LGFVLPFISEKELLRRMASPPPPNPNPTQPPSPRRAPPPPPYRPAPPLQHRTPFPHQTMSLLHRPKRNNSWIIAALHVQDPTQSREAAKRRNTTPTTQPGNSRSRKCSSHPPHHANSKLLRKLQRNPTARAALRHYHCNHGWQKVRRKVWRKKNRRPATAARQSGSRALAGLRRDWGARRGRVKATAPVLMERALQRVHLRPLLPLPCL
jgi:hypothetical protein